MSGLLALDLATKAGWAYRDGMDDPPQYGTFAIEGRHIGRFLANYDDWLQKIVQRLAPEYVAYEAPYVGNPSAIRKIYALTSHTEWRCLVMGLPCKEVAATTWRKHFLGRAKYERREAKQAAMQMCRTMGWKPADDNQADALGLLDYAHAMTFGVAEPQGLFAKR